MARNQRDGMPVAFRQRSPHLSGLLGAAASPGTSRPPRASAGSASRGVDPPDQRDGATHDLPACRLFGSAHGTHGTHGTRHRSRRRSRRHSTNATHTTHTTRNTHTGRYTTHTTPAHATQHTLDTTHDTRRRRRRRRRRRCFQTRRCASIGFDHRRCRAAPV